MKKILILLSFLCVLFTSISCKQNVDATSVNFSDTISKEIYNSQNLKEILKNETTKEMQTRGFTTNEPIQASIDDNGNLVITSYAPVTVKNLGVFIKNNGSLSPLTLVEEVYGFSQSVLPLKTKLTKDTKLCVSSTTDPFMKKISKITSPMKVSFLQDTNGPWKPIDPLNARKASILLLTMSYMFNHPDYLPHLIDWNNGGYVGKDVTYVAIPGILVFPWLPSAPFKKDDGSPLDANDVLRFALDVDSLNITLIKESEPAGGVGGGSILGIRDYLFDKFLKYTTLPGNGQNQKELKCYVVDVIFHEFAHCMGFMHNTDPYPGTMTYGGGWTTANYVFLNKLIENNDLPVPLDGSWEKNIDFPSNL